MRAFTSKLRLLPAVCSTQPRHLVLPRSLVSASVLPAVNASVQPPSFALAEDPSKSRRTSESRGFAVLSAAAATAVTASAAATFSTSTPVCHAQADPVNDAPADPPAQGMVTLFQYDVCPFCNKVKAYLDYHQVPYSVVEVNPLSKAEIKWFSPGYQMVPIAIVEGVGQVNGSREIIAAVADGMVDNKASTNDEASCSKWEQWVDDWLVHLLPPNIYRTPGEALQAFDYITTNSNFSFWQKLSVRYSGAAIMYMIAKRAKDKYGLSDNARQDMIDALGKWVNEGLTSDKLFHGGAKPDIADLSVFGVIRAIDGDMGSATYKTWDDLKASDAEHMSRFWVWYEAMREVVPAPLRVAPENSPAPAPAVAAK